VRDFAPVILDRLHDQLDAGRMADKLVGAEPNGMASEAVIAHLLEILFRHDPARPRRQGSIVGHEIGPRLVQMEAHPVGIDDLYLPDFLLQGVGFVA
jgi:hypothetical protein